MKSKYFFDSLFVLYKECPSCGGKTWVEEIPSDPGEGFTGYLLPIEEGRFDIVCVNGHRFQIDWSAKVKKELRKKEKQDAVQSSTTSGNYASVPIRGNEVIKVESTVVSSTETGRGEMSMPHRKSWRSYIAEQRGQSDSECAPHRERSSKPWTTIRDGAGWRVVQSQPDIQRDSQHSEQEEGPPPGSRGD